MEACAAKEWCNEAPSTGSCKTVKIKCPDGEEQRSSNARLLSRVSFRPDACPKQSQKGWSVMGQRSMCVDVQCVLYGYTQVYQWYTQAHVGVRANPSRTKPSQIDPRKPTRCRRDRMATNAPHLPGHTLGGLGSIIYLLFFLRPAPKTKSAHEWDLGFDCGAVC